MNRTFAAALLCAVTAMLAACKPPPTDADLRRDVSAAGPSFASAPLPSPDTEGAVWARSPAQAERLIYGIPGNPALLALECVDEPGELPALQITRISPADEGAGAMLALIGNGHIGRIAVDAVRVNGASVWQGRAPAGMTAWEPLAGPRQLTVTVPGAGMVTVNPSEMPWEMVAKCRGDVPPPPELPELAPVELPEPLLSAVP